MAVYCKPEYWDERYTHDPEPFDWYQRWAGIKEVALEVGIRPEHNILIVGCGNSRLSEEMYNDGFKQLTNIDISSVVIKLMQEKYADRPGMIYRELNCMDMSVFPNESFDNVIDKGTIDSLLCGEGSTNNVQQMLKEISRVLKPGGLYFCVSYGLPSYRFIYLQRAEYGWTVSIRKVKKPTMGIAPFCMDENDSVHYIYTCHKTPAGGDQETASSPTCKVEDNH